MIKIKQTEKVLQYMQEVGEITALDALREFSCMRLASRISDLKKQGWLIKKRMRAAKNKYGDTVHFAVYTLAEEEDFKCQDQ